MLKLFKAKDLTDPTVYWYDGEDDIETPDGLNQCVHVYHVHAVEESQADYSTNAMNESSKIHYKFTSSEGFEAFKKSQFIYRSTDVNSITNPSCLISLGREDLLSELEIEEEPVDDVVDPE
jgi:hypothetical protein